MMKRKIFDRLKSICRAYDPFTQYIDSYKQEKEAERCNKKLNEEFQSILSEYTSDTVSIPWQCENCHGQELEDSLLEVMKKLGIEVEPRKIWTEKEVANMIQTNNKVLLGVLRKTNFYTGRSKFIDKSDRKFLNSVFSFYLKNDNITNNQAAAIRRVFAKYTKELTELANELD